MKVRKTISNFESEYIKLPSPRYDGEISVEKALKERRSIRSYKDDPLTLSEISQLLWAAQGVTDTVSGYYLRTAPSAGALYPLELYVMTGNVDDLPPGIYKYDPFQHELAQTMKEDKRIDLFNAALKQSCIKNAPASILIACVYRRMTNKYGERANRYALIEVGHAAQNIYLQAFSLKIGAVFIGAFYDEKVKMIMNMPDDEDPLCIMPIGKY